MKVALSGLVDSSAGGLEKPLCWAGTLWLSPRRMLCRSRSHVDVCAAGGTPSTAQGRQGPSLAWWAQGEGDGCGDCLWECWCVQGCAEGFAAALTTQLLIRCNEMSVQSPVSPSLSLFLLLTGSTIVEMLSRGLALARPPGVERSLAVFWSRRCTLCLLYSSRHSTTFLYALFYL